MGKYLALIALLFSLIAIPAFAADEAATTPAVSFEVGGEGDFVLNRAIEMQDIDDIVLDYSSQNYDLVGKVKLADIITLIGRAGLTTAQATTDVGSTDIDLNSGVGFNLGAGVRADVLKTKYVNLAGIADYRFTRVDIDEVKIGGYAIDNPLEAIVYTHEWEVGAIADINLKEWLSENLKMQIDITPYIGLVYSDLTGSADFNTSTLIGGDIKEDLSAQDHVGLRLGLKAQPLKDLFVSIDCKLVDQTAVAGRVTYRF
jgi:hypothetical protein